MKLYFILFVGLFLFACTQGEPQINKRQKMQIQRMVEYKVDSLRLAHQIICYEAVLEAAIPKADSIISTFENANSDNIMNRPQKPKKPAKPKVDIPAFEK